MQSIHRPILIMAAMAIPFALVSGPALAVTPERDGVRISLSDLNLSTQSGVRALYGRIHAAANRYCGSIFSQTGSRISAGFDGCVADSINNTVRSLNLPALTALHAERGNQQNRS